MLTNPFTTRTASSRRNARRQAIVRRGWLVQRLEPRCVMAADFSGSELAELAWADDRGIEPTDGVPSFVSTIRPITHTENTAKATGFDEPDFELSIDGLDDVVEDIAVDQRGDASIEIVDLLGTRSIDLELQQNSTVVFTWDVSQLDELLGSADSVIVHVVYDASRWQALLDEHATTEFDFTDSEEDLEAVDQKHELFNSTLKMLSLADQSVRIQVDIQVGSVEEGTLPQVFVKLMGLSSSDAAGAKWTSEEFDWDRSLDLASSIAPEERWDFQGSKIEQVVVDNAAGINPSDKSDAGYPSTDNTMIGEESDHAQPLSEGDSSPLPESRRESPERSTRSARRTLDLRSAGAVSSTAPLANRTAVRQDSLATQAAIAGVYESEPSTANGQSRWLLDAKPAKLQVATFLLSRSSDGSRTVMARSEGSRIVDQPGQAQCGPENKANQATAPTQSVLPQVASQASNDEPTSESVIGETLTRVDERIDETHEDLEEAVREVPVYANIVDRLLGSPISLVAVLGLTAIARFTEPEDTQHLG